MLRRQLLQLPREVVQQKVVLLVQSALVRFHLDLALLLELQQCRLMLASHPLVARHLLVHVLLHVLLLLLGDDARGSDGGEVVRSVFVQCVDCRLRGVIVMSTAVYLLLDVLVLPGGSRRLQHHLLRVVVMMVAVSDVLRGVGVYVLRLLVMRRNRRRDAMTGRVPVQDALLVTARLNGTARRVLTARDNPANRLHAVLRRDAVALAAVAADLIVRRVVSVAHVALRLAVVHHENLLHLTII